MTLLALLARDVSGKEIDEQTAHRDDESSFEGVIAELLKPDLPAVGASQPAKQFLGAHFGAASVAIQDCPFHAREVMLPNGPLMRPPPRLPTAPAMEAALTAKHEQPTAKHYANINPQTVKTRGPGSSQISVSGSGGSVYVCDSSMATTISSVTEVTFCSDAMRPTHNIYMRIYGTLTDSGRLAGAFTAAVLSNLSQANLCPSAARFKVFSNTMEKSCR